MPERMAGVHPKRTLSHKKKSMRQYPIDEICRVSERTKSWIVKKALDSYLEDIGDVEIALERSSTDKKEYLTGKKLRENLKHQE